MTLPHARPILIVAAALAAFLAVTVTAVIWFMSDPDRATPILRSQIERIGGRPVALESGWVEPGWRPRVRLRGLEIESMGHADILDLRINLLGALFGGRVVQAARMEEAAFNYRPGGLDGDGAPDALDRVRRVEIRELRLFVHRQGRDPALLIVNEAAGDLSTGDFSLTAAGGRATLRLRGSAEGLALAGFDGEMELQGSNFAELAEVFGLAAPDTPPFSITGDLGRDGAAWRLDPVDGVVGDSDIAGWMAADFSGERPRLTADLVSQTLDLDDLGVAIGAPSSVDDGPENEAQRAANAQFARSDRYIPNARLDFERVRYADADVRFRAESVQAGPVPLQAMEVEFSLEGGVMRFEPVAFDASGGGRLTAWATIDGTTDPVRSEVEGELDRFDMDAIAGGRLLRGGVVSRFNLAMDGSDLHTAFASADGTIHLWALPGAEIRHLAVEGAGLDIGEVLLLRLREDGGEPRFIPLRCAGARLLVEDGIARPDPALLDTADSLVIVEGEIDLRTEDLDLQVEADQKDVSWGGLLGGVEIGGTLRHPEIGVNPAAALFQGGAAALLGGISGGLAALPFADLGFGQDAACAALQAGE